MIDLAMINMSGLCLWDFIPVKVVGMWYSVTKE